MSKTSLPQLQPFDEYNQTLQSHVHPTDWINPTPSGRYNLVVIGGGTAGLVSAVGAAGLGANVALIEKDLMGGDCLNVGCVPSKAMISAGRAAAAVRRANEFGIAAAEPQVDFGQVMQRMRRLRAKISPHDSAARFQELGVDVFLGSGEFTDRATIRVTDDQGRTQDLSFRKSVIATGARASAPPIPGLDQVDYLTNETVFSLTELPPKLGIIGAGPIGCEMAQTFSQLGSEVWMINIDPHVLPREDPDAAAIVEQQMRDDGVRIQSEAQQLNISNNGSGIDLKFTVAGKPQQCAVDRLLVAVGRAPNVENLGLNQVGVEFNPKGIIVDDRMRTTNKRIFAAGDVASKFQFTHAADFLARTVIGNSLFMGRRKASDLLIPWATYTTPEIAHVGIYPAEAEKQGIAIDTYLERFDRVDRAILESEEAGFVKIHTRQGTDRILGATIVANHAGDMISEITLAMKNRIGLGKISSVIHPYPTQAEAIRKIGDQYNRTRLTPLVKQLMGKWLAWTR